MGSEKTYADAIVIAAFGSSLQKALDENAALEAKLREARGLVDALRKEAAESIAASPDEIATLHECAYRFAAILGDDEVVDGPTGLVGDPQ